MSEADEQRAVVEWCAWRRIPVFHIPGGGSRHPAEAARLKAQGVKAGVPDLCIPVARGAPDRPIVNALCRNAPIANCPLRVGAGARIVSTCAATGAADPQGSGGNLENRILDRRKPFIHSQ